MYKKIFALALAINCVASQCEDNKKPAEVTEEQVALAQVEAAKQELHDMSSHTTTAYMGATISVLGVVASLATLYIGKANPELQNYALGTCATAVGGGLFVAWTAENGRGNPQERTRLITIIENAQKSTKNYRSI